MERERFQVEADNTAWLHSDDPPVQPVLNLHYTGSRDRLEAALDPRVRSDFSADELEIAFRVIAPATATTDGEGVFSLSDRVTGTYLLETTTSASHIRTFCRAVQAYADRTENRPDYELRLHANAEMIASLDTDLLLVFDPDGTLLQDPSLIPHEIEL